MAIEAEDRPTAQEALQDPWIRDIESDPNMNKIVHSKTLHRMQNN